MGRQTGLSGPRRMVGACTPLLAPGGCCTPWDLGGTRTPALGGAVGRPTCLGGSPALPGLASPSEALVRRMTSSLSLGPLGALGRSICSSASRALSNFCSGSRALLPSALSPYPLATSLSQAGNDSVSHGVGGWGAAPRAGARPGKLVLTPGDRDLLQDFPATLHSLLHRPPLYPSHPSLPES